MEQNLINGLQDLGYNGPLLDKANLQAAVEEGSKSIEYTKLVNFLTNELRTLLNIDEEVNVITCHEDAVAFVMEVGSFLRELNCPYTRLMHGHISDRLQTIPDKLLLLDYLSKELMGTRILQEKKPDKKIELKLQETEEAARMRKILQALRFPKPPPNITVETLFQKLTPSLQTIIKKAGNDLVGNPAFNGHLSDKQWEILNGVQEDLNKEYKIRREMLLTRLDVTIQSFQWSDKTRGKDDLFEQIYTDKRKKLKTDPHIDISDLLVARDEIAIIEKTSNSTVRKNTKSSLNKVIIGQVPDRGGRTSEQAPPPPEMPSWQQRSAGPPGGGRGRGGGGGNFSRGNFNNNQNYRGKESATYSNRGSYSGGGGNNSYSSNQGGGYSNSGSYGSGSYSNQGGGNSSFASNQGSGYANNSAGYGGSSYSSNNQRSDYGNSGNHGGSYSSNNRGGGGYDSSGSYGGYGGGNKSRGNSGNYSQGRSYDSSGGYDSNREGYDTSRDQNRRSSGGDSFGNRSFDSAGSYEQNTKRAKTYDSYQSNKTTYADQYVQEEKHNQQYHGSRGGSRGRGRSNYNRGGRNN